MQYILPIGTTFINTINNPATIVGFRKDDMCYKIRHDSGVFVHTHHQVHMYIGDGQYTNLKLPNIDMIIIEPEYELY